MSGIDGRDKNLAYCPICGAVRINMNVTFNENNDKTIVGFCRQCEEEFVINNSLIEISSQFEEDGHV